MPEPFSTLTSLPGGNDRYLVTLLAVLRWVRDSAQPTRASLTDWFGHHYQSASNSSVNYINGLTRLDVIGIDGLDRIRLTAFGQRLLMLAPPEAAREVLDYLLAHCIGLREVLTVYLEAAEPLHISTVQEQLRDRFPQWTNLTPYEQRVLWLLSLGCLAQVKGRYYRPTPLGQTALDGRALSAVTSVELLIAELEAAAVDGANPQRLQQVAGAIFRALGYAVTDRGGPGDTDLLVDAPIGPSRYRAIVEVKARGNGRLAEFSGFALDQHRGRHQADHALVIANDFAGGRLDEQAAAFQITLLPVAVLADLLRLHAETPLNLLVYRALFEAAGRVNQLPERLIAAGDERRLFEALVAAIRTTIHDLYRRDPDHRLTVEQLYGMLIARSQRCTPEQVSQALAYLAHPLVGELVWLQIGRASCRERVYPRV